MSYREEKEGLGSRLILEISDNIVNEDDIKSFWDELARFEGKFSRFVKDSELSKLNNRAGHWEKVSDEMLYFLRRCEELKKYTNGYFDVLVEKVLSGLGYDSAYSFQEKDYDHNLTGRIEFSEEGRVKLPSSIDFGGFGKGYALDMAKKYLNKYKGVCFNAGGDIWIHGTDPQGEKWKIYLENPLNMNEAIGLVEANDLFLASSNAKKRSWGLHHHLIDPHSGASAKDMLAVYVQAQEGFLVDAMSTTLFVMGYQKAKDFLLKSPIVEAMLISPEGGIWKTPGYQGELFLK